MWIIVNLDKVYVLLFLIKIGDLVYILYIPVMGFVSAKENFKF